MPYKVSTDTSANEGTLSQEETLEKKIERVLQRATVLSYEEGDQVYEYTQEDIKKVITETDLVKRRLLEYEIVEIHKSTKTETEERVSGAEEQIKEEITLNEKVLKKVLEISKEQILKLFKKVSGELKSDYSGQTSSSILIYNKDTKQWSSMLFSILNSEVYSVYYNPNGKTITEELGSEITNKLAEFCLEKNISFNLVDVQDIQALSELVTSDNIAPRIERVLEDSVPLVLGRMYQLLQKIAHIERKLDLHARCDRKEDEKQRDTVEEGAAGPAAASVVESSLVVEDGQGEKREEEKSEDRVRLFQSEGEIRAALLESVTEIHPFESIESLKEFL